MCDEWKADFLAFYSWSVANGFREELQLDRKDSTKGYSPDNCRWATPTQQIRNQKKRFNKKASSRFKGVSRDSRTKAAGHWRAGIVVNGMRSIIGTFSTEIEAAQAYDKVASVAFGEFAVLNFPSGCEPSGCSSGECHAGKETGQF